MSHKYEGSCEWNQEYQHLAYVESIAILDPLGHCLLRLSRPPSILLLNSWLDLSLWCCDMAWWTSANENNSRAESNKIFNTLKYSLWENYFLFKLFNSNSIILGIQTNLLMEKKLMFWTQVYHSMKRG